MMSCSKTRKTSILKEHLKRTCIYLNPKKLVTNYMLDPNLFHLTNPLGDPNLKITKYRQYLNLLRDDPQQMLGT
jgi:hypothetical protein